MLKQPGYEHICFNDKSCFLFKLDRFLLKIDYAPRIILCGFSGFFSLLALMIRSSSSKCFQQFSSFLLLAENLKNNEKNLVKVDSFHV